MVTHQHHSIAEVLILPLLLLVALAVWSATFLAGSPEKR